MKKSITMKQLAQLLREETAPELKKGPQQDAADLPVKKAVQEDDMAPAVPADPAAAPADPAADPNAAAAAPAPVDPSIVALVQQLATACGLQVTDPNAAAPAADPNAVAPADPAADPAAAQAVAERRARLRKLREARQRARLARRK